MADVLRIKVTAYVEVATHVEPARVRRELQRLVAWAVPVGAKSIDPDMIPTIDEILSVEVTAEEAE